jgi:DNA-binding XRE family transcriptional regulator
MGRKAHQPTDENKKQVELMAAVGITQEQIAQFLKISQDTLAKYYETELADGAIKANTKVASSLYTQAINGNVTAQIFWCKTRLGWRDRSEIELSSKDNSPLTAILRIEPKEDKK